MSVSQFLTRKKLYGLVAMALFLTVAAAVGCQRPSPVPGQGKEATLGYARPGLLVETGWLAQHLDDPDLVILDVRSAAGYKESHIPNALNLNPADLNVNQPVRGMAGPAGLVSGVLGNLGIDSDTQVVIYDDTMGLWAARVFWVMDYYGHRQVSLLNGGYPKWQQEGRPLTAEVPAVKKAAFPARAEPDKIATKGFVLNNLNNPGISLLDERTPAEYRGEEVRSARGGHIPGAINVPWTEAVTRGGVPVFKSQSELEELYRSAGLSRDKEVIIYCQTGVRAAHSYFVLRLIGYPQVRNYDGSWEEWGNDPAMPIER